MIMSMRARPGLMTALSAVLAALLLLTSHWHLAGHIVPGTSMYGLPATERVALLGDSILASAELPSPADHFDAQLAGALRIDPTRVLDDAVSGLSLTGAHPNLVDRAPAYLAALNPSDVVVLGIGMNDACAAGFSLAAFTSAYAALVGQAQALGLRLLVGQVTPVAPALWACEVPRQQIDAWIWATYPHGIVLRYPDVLASPGVTWIDPAKVTTDGKHPNELGTAQMATLTAGVILGPVVVHAARPR